MKFRFLGTGTSQGVPVIGCHCEVCTSQNPKDKRYRSAGLITSDSEKSILIDCGPDFRMQMLDNQEENVDAVLLTHEHNDHVIGLDDMRPLIFKNGKNMPLYCSERVGAEVRQRFLYAFADVRYPGAPAFDLHEITEDFTLFNIPIQPINVLHNYLPVLGYRVKNLAYITDASNIPAEEKLKLQDLDVLILNCIRKEPAHPAHFVLPEAIAVFNELKPKEMFLTHISHHLGLHQVVENELPPGMHLAYDGLQLDF